MSKTKCPFCGLYPFVTVNVGIGVMSTGDVECCEYGYSFYYNMLPYEDVKADFIETEGYEPPFKDTYLDNRQENI